MKVASFTARLVALIIDVILIAVLEGLLPLKILYYDILPANFENVLLSSLCRLEYLILSPLYFVGFRYWNHGRTLGKMAMRIKTVKEDGSAVGLSQSIVDCLGYYFLPLDWLIGFFLSNRGQRLTQVCARTVVVHDH